MKTTISILFLILFSIACTKKAASEGAQGVFEINPPRELTEPEAGGAEDPAKNPDSNSNNNSSSNEDNIDHQDYATVPDSAAPPSADPITDTNQPLPPPIAQPQPNTPIPLAATRYFVAVYGDVELDPAKPTHVLIAGYGSTMKTLFQYSAVSHAKKLKEIFPEHQIVFFLNNEELADDKIKNRELLLQWGFKIVKAEEKDFTGNEVIRFLSSYEKIESVDVYSHANTGSAFFQSYDNLESLKYSKGAYMVLYGCNAGYDIAKRLSLKLKIPVAGSLTSSDFQFMHTLGDFYRYEESLKPKTGDWEKVNKFSFAASANCSQGGCMRMKPDEFPYDGMWGKKESGLPYYKFYCLANTQEECLRAKSKWLVGYVTMTNLKKDSSYDEFKIAVRDYLCPNRAETENKAKCELNLKKSEVGAIKQYSPFLGPMPKCDWKDCEFNQTAKTTFIDEYLEFLQAYKYLSAVNQPSKSAQ